MRRIGGTGGVAVDDGDDAGDGDGISGLPEGDTAGRGFAGVAAPDAAGMSRLPEADTAGRGFAGLIGPDPVGMSGLPDRDAAGCCDVRGAGLLTVLLSSAAS